MNARLMLQRNSSSQHEALHSHKIFLREEWETHNDWACSILSCFKGFYRTIVKVTPYEHFQVKETFAGHIANLDTDLPNLGGVVCVDDYFLAASESERLGWYYVALGASFGRKSLFRHINSYDDGYRSCFLEAPVNLEGWNWLMGKLERSNASELPLACNGAAKAFSVFETLCDQVLLNQKTSYRDFSKQWKM